MAALPQGQRGIQQGPNVVSDPRKLLGALNPMQPPQHPGTPLERLNPDKEFMERTNAAIASLEQAAQKTNDQHILLAYNAMQGALKAGLMPSASGEQVIEALRNAVQSFPPPVAPAAGGVPGASPAGVPGQGAPPAAPMGGAIPPPALTPGPGGPLP